MSELCAHCGTYKDMKRTDHIPIQHLSWTGPYSGFTSILQVANEPPLREVQILSIVRLVGNHQTVFKSSRHADTSIQPDVPNEATYLHCCDSSVF